LTSLDDRSGTNSNGETKSFNDWFKGEASTVMEVLKKTYNLEASNGKDTFSLTSDAKQCT
jgi:hypothetical protein